MMQPVRERRVRAATTNGPMVADPFVCNVSHDDIIERDIDLEIEARIRSLTLSSDEEDVAPRSQQPQPQRTLQHSMSLSQRMLKAARNNRLKRSQTVSPRMPTHAITEEERHESQDSFTLKLPQCVDSLLDRERSSKLSSTSSLSLSADTPMEKGQRPSKQSTVSSQSQSFSRSMGSDLDGLLLIDSTPNANEDWPYLSDEDLALSVSPSSILIDENTNMTTPAAAENQQQQSNRHRAATTSAPFSGRRTYPAPSAKTMESRFSEREIETPKPKTQMDIALENQLARLREYPRCEESCPERSASTTTDRRLKHSLSLSRVSTAPRSSRSSYTSSGRSSSNSSAGVPSFSLPQSQSQPQARLSSSALSPSEERAKMDATVKAIENVVQELEQAFTTETFFPMAKEMNEELDMLCDSLTTMRQRGITLIFEEMQDAHYESAELLRGVVASAVRTQTRVEALKTFVRSEPAVK